MNNSDVNTTKIKLTFSIIIMVIFLSLMGWNCYNFLGYKGIFPKITDEKFRNIMGRDKTWYAGPTGGRFFSGVFQNQLEKATADHFPIGMITAMKKFNKSLTKLILMPLPKKIRPLTPIDENYGMIKNDTCLVELKLSANINEGNYKKLLSEQALYYNSIVTKFPNIQLLIMPILNKYNWYLKSEIKMFYLNGFQNDSVDIFQTMLNPKIICSVAFEDHSPNEALNLYYRTDHHFSIRGAYDAYLQIIKLFNHRTNDPIFPLKPKTWFVLPDIKFRGSLSRRAGGILDVYDKLEDAEFNLPTYSIFINETFSSDGYGEKTKYFGELNNAEKFEDHYGKYFGGDFGLVKIVNSDRSILKNLLVIGDSFDNSIIPLISSHFHNNFFVDLRHYEKQMGTSFDIIDFIYSNKIDYVIFIGSMDRVFYFNSLKH